MQRQPQVVDSTEKLREMREKDTEVRHSTELSLLKVNIADYWRLAADTTEIQVIRK